MAKARPVNTNSLTVISEAKELSFNSDTKVIMTGAVFDKGGCHDFYYSADPRVQRAVILIETFVRSNKDLHGIADKVGLSDRQLSRLFKQQFGLSPKRYIINTRLRYALWMIENTNPYVSA